MALTVQDALTRINEMEAKCASLSYAVAVLANDGSTVAPKRSVTMRGESLASLTEQLYHLTVNPEVEEALELLREHTAELDDRTARRVELLLEDLDRQKKIPVEDMMEFTRLRSEGHISWVEAKDNNDFDVFAPVLQKLVDMSRRIAGYTDPDKHPYDAMLDRYEKGMTRDYCDSYFGALREKLVPLVAAVSEKPQPDTSFLKGSFPIDKQRILSRELMNLLTIDPERCVLAETEHPYTSGASKNDVRITTHYYENNPLSSLYSVIHEGGHALYELGIGDELQGTCLADVPSMAMHESQSRFFENLIGRSEGFCTFILPKLKELFPTQFADVTARQLYCAVNLSQPSLIRIEADELTYSLHIMVRYEVEKALFSGEVTVSELPGVWNELYKKYLGVDVPDNQRGVLQDTHWSGAQFGYFPSYSVGSAYASQMYAAMSRDLDVASLAAKGDLAPVCDWLGSRMWQHGSMLRSQDTVQAVCGEAFTVDYYTDYLTKKMTDVYGL